MFDKCSYCKSTDSVRFFQFHHGFAPCCVDCGLKHGGWSEGQGPLSVMMKDFLGYPPGPKLAYATRGLQSSATGQETKTVVVSSTSKNCDPPSPVSDGSSPVAAVGIVRKKLVRCNKCGRRYLGIPAIKCSETCDGIAE